MSFFLVLKVQNARNAAAPYPVRPARPRPYLDFEKEKAAAAAAVARRHYRVLPGLGARAAPVAPLIWDLF